MVPLFSHNVQLYHALLTLDKMSSLQQTSGKQPPTPSGDALEQFASSRLAVLERAMSQVW